MKSLLLLFFFAAASCAAQSPKDLLSAKDGWSIRYYLGETPIKERPLALHLEKNNSRAASEFALMRKANRNGLWWSAAFVAGTAGMLLAKDNAVQLAFGAPAIAGATGGLICTINEQKYRKRAIKYYNAGVK